MNRKLLVVVTMLATFATCGLVDFLTTEKTSAVKETIANSDEKLPTVGILQFITHPALDDICEGVKDGLAKRGYVDGESVNIVYQNGQGDQNKLSVMSQQLLDEKSELFVGIGTNAVQALANMTKDLPIILGGISNPERTGLVESNERPGNNITGVSLSSPVDEQLVFLQKLLPDTKKIGILYSAGEDNSREQATIVGEEAKKIGLSVQHYSVPSTNEITPMVTAMCDEVDVIYIPTDNTIASAMPTVSQIATSKNTPILPAVDTMVAEGGLATIGVNQYELGVKTGEMAADVLDGKSEPATTPVYDFREGTLVVNQKQMAYFNLSLPEGYEEATFIEGDEGK